MNSNLGKLSLVAFAAASLFTHAFANERELKTTVVTAKREAKLVQDHPSSVTVLTHAQIKASGASNVSQAIITLMGLSSSTDLFGRGNNGFDLRGFGNTAGSNQLVIVDGQMINNDDMSGANLASVPIEDVEKIEVISGAGAVEYGSGATGGVILVTTKAGMGVKRKNAATIDASYGSFNTLSEYGSATLAQGGISVDVAGKNSTSDGYRDNFGNTINNLAATVQWSNDWLRVGARGGRYMQQSGLPGPLPSNATNNNQASSMLNHGKMNSNTGGLFAQAILADWTLNWNFNQRIDNVESYYAPGPITTSNIEAYQNRATASHGWQTDTIKNNLTLGLDGGNWSNRASYSRASSEHFAGFVNNDLTWLPTGTLLNLGFRQASVKKDGYSMFGGQPAVHLDEKPQAWMVGLTQSIADGFSIYGHVGSSYRLANADEFTFTPNGTVLKTQTSRDYETGVRWNNTNSKAEFHWFRSDLNNEIGYDAAIPNANSWNGKGANVNFDPSQHEGFVLSWTSKLNDVLALRARFAHQNATFTQGPRAGRDLPGIPKNTAALGLMWSPLPQGTLDVNLNWVDSQRVSMDGSCTAPDYTTVNARYSYQLRKNVELAVAANNLFNTNYYSATSCAGSTPASRYPEMGQNFTGSVEIKF